MPLCKVLPGPLLAALLVLAVPGARGGTLPVIDAAAVASLVEQVGYWKQQITSMASQLDQLQQTHRSLTGDRGMGALLATPLSQRNYLPPDHAGLARALDGSTSTYAGLSGQLQSIMAANAVLSKEQLTALSPEQRQVVEAGRRSAALLSASSRAAYQNTSQRFAALQFLIESIGSAGDLKAIQDLQARVSSEQAMLTNEQTKLQSIYQVVQADHWAQQQQIREQVISNHGSFSKRFSPSPALIAR